jgi:hypothetical protein
MFRSSVRGTEPAASPMEPGRQPLPPRRSALLALPRERSPSATAAGNNNNGEGASPSLARGANHRSASAGGSTGALVLAKEPTAGNTWAGRPELRSSVDRPPSRSPSEAGPLPSRPVANSSHHTGGGDTPGRGSSGIVDSTAVSRQGSPRDRQETETFGSIVARSADRAAGSARAAGHWMIEGRNRSQTSRDDTGETTGAPSSLAPPPATAGESTTSPPSRSRASSTTSVAGSRLPPAPPVAVYTTDPGKSSSSRDLPPRRRAVVADSARA